MDKEQVKAKLGDAAAKAKGAMSEIKANFKADDGTTGFRKIQSMFVNLWKSGMTGKSTLIACPVAVLLLLCLLFSGGGKTGDNAGVSVANNEETTKKAMADIARAQEEAVAATARAQEEAMAATARAQKEAAAAIARVKQQAEAAAARAEEEAAADAARAQKNAKSDEVRAQNESPAKEEIEIKDVASAKKALRAAFASGDVIAAQKAQEALSRMEELEAKEKAEREAKELAEFQAKAEAEEAAQVAKAKAEREAKEKAKRAAFEAIPDKLVVKGLYAGMPGDSALEACKQLVATEGDLVVVDYRKGIEREKDEETKAKERKIWEAQVKMAEADVEKFLKWNCLSGNMYDPSAEQCEGPLDYEACHPSLRWRGANNVLIADNNGTLAMQMAVLAGFYGYQVQWMIPGKRNEGKKKEASKPKFSTGRFGIPAEAKGYRIQKYWKEHVYKQAIQDLYAKGLQIAKGYESKVFFRLVLQDASGSPIEKRKLATELVLGTHEDYFKEASSREEKLKIAEREVDSFLEWAEIGDDFVRAANRTATAKKDSSNLKFIKSGGDFSAAMKMMAQNCKAMVEWAVFTQPAEKLEEITETITIPKKEMKGAYGFVKQLDRKLGKNHSDEASRKRLFFEKDLVEVYSPLWFRLVLKTTNGVEVAKEDVVKNWLTARGYYKPSEKIKVPPKNLIQVSINQKGVPDDKLKGLCFVWIDEAGNVKETYYNAEGMNRFFDAKDLSGEEFANLLVKSYPGLPSLKMNVEKKNPGRGIIKECTWTYSCPKGYKVKLFERSYFSNSGAKYDSKMLERDPEASVALSLVDLLPDKYLSISATKSASARKFD